MAQLERHRDRPKPTRCLPCNSLSSFGSLANWYLVLVSFRVRRSPLRYLSAPDTTMPDKKTRCEKKKMINGMINAMNEAAMIKFGSVS